MLKHILCFVAFVLCIFGVVIVGPLLTFYLRHHCKDKSARVMSQRIENVDDLDMNKIEFSENLILGKRMNKQMSIANPNMKGKPKKDFNMQWNIFINSIWVRYNKKLLRATHCFTQRKPK